MKIKITRDYIGEEGTDVDRNVVAGTELVVSRARGNALHANGLADILEDEAEPEDETMAQQQTETKAITSPQNKAITTPQNKAAGQAPVTAPAPAAATSAPVASA